VIPARDAFVQANFKAPSADEGTDLKVKARPSEGLSIKITRDVINEEVIAEVKSGRAFTLVDRDLTHNYSGTVRSQISTKDPGISSLRTEHYEKLCYANGLTVGSRGTGVISSDREQFVIHLKVNVDVNGRPYWEKSWLKTVPRHFT
jgi:hypothetical protein